MALLWLVFEIKHKPKPQVGTVETQPPGEAEERKFEMSLLKTIEVLPDHFIRLVHPLTQEVVKIFEGGEKIVEKEFGLTEGTIEANHAADIKVSTLVPTVQSGTVTPGVPVAQAQATATTPGSAA